MHETAVILALAEQVHQFLPERGQLRQVHIEVGHLEHLDEGTLLAAWQAITAAGTLEGASLVVDWVRMRVRCRGCGGEYEPANITYLVCPDCRAARPEILSGSGILLRSLEVDVPDEEDSEASGEAPGGRSMEPTQES